MADVSKRNSRIGPISREEILHIAGDLDEATILAILKTGATLADVEEAVMLLSGESEDDHATGIKRGRPVAEVYDILATTPVFVLDEDR